MKYILIFLALSLLSACVSVKLSGPTAQVTKANNYTFTQPEKPFVSTSSKNSDASWISSATGNTISFFTSCSNNEPPIRNIRSTALQGFEAIQIKEEAALSISSREGLRSLVEGQIEGIPVLIDLIIFKKNSCSYQLNYISLKDNFNKERSLFEKFIKNFKVN